MSSQCNAPLKHVNFAFRDSTERLFEAPTLDQAPFVISNSVNDVSVGYFHIKYSTQGLHKKGGQGGTCPPGIF